MDLISIAVNPEKELEGARVEIDDETTLIIARYNNAKFRNMQANMMEPYVRSAGRKGVTTKQADKILCKCMAKCILLGWEGLKLEGELVEYSKDKCLEVLQDARLADFKELVLLESQNLENYRLESLEEDLGNSEPSSDTAADGT